MLSAEHVEGLERLAEDPEVAEIMEVSATAYVARRIVAQGEGSAWSFAIIDQGSIVGVSTLTGLDGGEPTANVWVAPRERRKGYGAFALRMLVEFAFRNLSLTRVAAEVPEVDDGPRRVLEKTGFVARESGRFLITPERWREFRDGPALADLHSDLKAILESELKAGNEVVETGRGWPDPDSVFVRLRNPFASHPSPLPEGVTYTEPNDPHWWKADYTTCSPRHTLAC